MNFPQRPPRYPTYIPVVISQGEDAQSAYIVDLNSQGACISGIANLKKDQTVHLRGAIETSIASVRWSDKTRAGVRFDRPIPPQFLAMLRLRSQAYHTTPPVTQMRTF